MPFGRRRFGERSFGEKRWGGGWRREGFGRRDEPKPVKEGEEYDVTIAEMSRKGDGIARIQNFVVFVAGTKAGDKVRIRIKEVHGRHAVGEVVSESAKTPIEKHESEEEIVEEAVEEPEEEELEEGEVPEIGEEEEGAA